jgi:3-hydroxyacyl-[acyl-carrier-protein] dehydratase
MRWIWIDRFVEFVPGVEAKAVKNVSLAEEHLHDHWEDFPVMPVSLMIEGMAQTAGMLVGQARDFREKVILAKISKADMDEPVVPGDQITYHAQLQTITEQGASTHGTVLRNGRAVGTVDLMFSHVDQNLAGVKFPEENFVFTEQFLRLLAGFVDTAPEARGV